MRLKSSPSMRRAAGFTLVELLITLIIVSVGILGIAKMEAAGVAESQVSRVRSLMTFQAESLAGSMRANRSYWTTKFTTVPTFTVISGTPSIPTTANGTDPTCASAICSSAEMTYADLKVWSDNFTGSFPGASASVVCSAGSCSTGSTAPSTFDITLTWNEKSVAVNRSSVGTGTTLPVSMVLHVQP